LSCNSSSSGGGGAGGSGSGGGGGGSSSSTNNAIIIMYLALEAITNSDWTINLAYQLYSLQSIKQLYRSENVILNETQFCIFALACILEYKYSSCLQN
jgi:hypothetical protein